MENGIREYITGYVKKNGEDDGVGLMVYASNTSIDGKWEVLNTVLLPEGLFATVVPYGKDDEQYMIPVEDVFGTKDEFHRFFRA